MTDTKPRDLIKRLADIADALDGRKPLVSAQGQAMDGFTALANFRALAAEARAYLAQPEPEGPTGEPLGDLIDKWVQEAFCKKPYGCTHPTHTYVACKAFEHGRNHAAHAALAQPEPSLTVENCSNMHKHRFNFLDEDRPGEITLDGLFTREDLIEIANTVPSTKA
jgi:hypothetical protein